jgi:hypothetical protein
MTSKFDDFDTMSLPPDSPQRDPYENLTTKPIASERPVPYRVVRQKNKDSNDESPKLLPSDSQSESKEKWKSLDLDEIDCSKALLNLFVNIPESLAVDHAVEKRIIGK